MSLFLTRIELHNAIFPDDYDVLHKAITKKGFSHNIKADDGTVFELPTAEYLFNNTNVTVEEVYNLAIQAANTVGKRYWIITTLFNQAKMDLKRVNSQQ